MNALVPKLPDIILESIEGLLVYSFSFTPSQNESLFSCIYKAQIPAMPGVYLVYENNVDEIGNLLYIGKAGADKNGVINQHSVPSRLLATRRPPKWYELENLPNHSLSAQVWPEMMKHDGLNSIIVYCILIPFKPNSKSELVINPIELEKTLKEKCTFKPKWGTR